MAIIRRSGGGEATPSLRGEFEPLRVFSDLLRWDPFRGAGWDPFRQMQPFTAERGFVPQFEVKETKEGYVFKADLPGVKESDLDISLSGNLLTVSGKRESEEREEGDTYYAYERSFGTFSRSFTLPEGADAEHCTADMKGGVLTLVLPKKPEMQPRKIAVKASGEKEKMKA